MKNGKGLRIKKIVTSTSGAGQKYFYRVLKLALYNLIHGFNAIVAEPTEMDAQAYVLFLDRLQANRNFTLVIWVVYQRQKKKLTVPFVLPWKLIGWVTTVI